MDKIEIDALLKAHGGRAHTVASLHVLRAPTLSAADHAFIAENADQLATIDFHRWLVHATSGQRSAVIDALADYAAKEPARFEHEIARAPRFPLSASERKAMAERLRGKVPGSLLAALSPDEPAPAAAPKAASTTKSTSAPTSKSATPVAGQGAPAASPAASPPGDGFFDPSELLGAVDFGGASTLRSGGDAPLMDSGQADSGLEDLLGGPDLFGGSEGEGASRFISRAPALDALFAALPAAKSTKARSAWKARARAIAADMSEDWGPVVTTLPADLRDAVLLRAATSPRTEERAALLEWLFQNGAKRAELVELTLLLLGLGDKAGVRDWLAQSWIPKLLADRSGWSKHGPSVLGAFIEQRAFTELDELFSAVFSGIAPAGPGLLSMTGPDTASLSGPLLVAFARALAAVVENGINAGHSQDALAGAAALACLGVPSKERAKILALRRKRGAKGDVATLLALADARPRRPDHTPRLEDLVATVHVLSDAFG